jgi:PAS domain S-box-containing protein
MGQIPYDGEQIIASRQTIRAILDASPIGIGLIRADVSQGWCNTAMARLTGYEPEEMIGLPVDRLAVSLNEYLCAEYQAQIRLAAGSPTPFRFRFKRKDGTIREVDIHLAPVDRDNLDQGVIAVVVDVTDLHQAKAMAQANKEALGILWEISPVGIGYMRGPILARVNPTLCSMSGYNADELEGQSLELLLADQPEWETTCPLLPGRRWVSLFRKDGTSLEVMLRAHRLENHPEGLDSIFTAQLASDAGLATSRVEDYKAQLAQLARELSRAEEQERGRVAEKVHDGLSQTLALLRIGLQSILGTKNRRLQTKLRSLVALVDKAFSEARAITAELSPPILRELGLEAGLGWLADHTFRHHGVVTRFKSDWKQRPLDPDAVAMLYRAAQELVINAVKHGRPSMIQIMLRNNDDQLELCVQDDGKGFDISRLNTFVPSGYGLFSIKERVKSLGGKGTIGSRPGVGTTVIITVPLASCTP